MSIKIINHVIIDTCLDIKTRFINSHNWPIMSESELLYEVVLCIVSSQVQFELAESMTKHLFHIGLIQPDIPDEGADTYRYNIINALSVPLPIINSNGQSRWARPRFKNRLGSLLSSTIFGIYGQFKTIKSILVSARTSKEVREELIRNIWGFGPKQASLFLRRIGFCSDLAVLDVHICDYLRLAIGINLTTAKLSRLPFYEEVEEQFREIAANFGYSVGCVDLATWLTMRVAKREALL